MGLKLEDWTALASLGLSVMFVALLLSFYNFLIGPEGAGPQRVVEPGSLMLQIVFISAAPSIALAGFAFVMGRAFGAKIGGTAVLAAGIIMVGGMAVGLQMLPQIADQYVVGIVGVAPYFFLAAGAGVAIMGGLLIVAIKKRRISNLDDLR